MEGNIGVNIIRFILIVLFQVLLFKGMAMPVGEFASLHFLIYPILIMLLPLRTPKPLIVVLGFITGLIIDLFYDSPGVHAGALTFTAFLRGVVLSYLEPFEGYNMKVNPNISHMGMQWFLTYAGILLFAHLLFYFSMSYFSFVFIGEILINTILSFIASYVIIMLYTLIFNPQ